jgi:hypothetical protein
MEEFDEEAAHTHSMQGCKTYTETSRLKISEKVD